MAKNTIATLAKATSMTPKRHVRKDQKNLSVIAAIQGLTGCCKNGGDYGCIALHFMDASGMLNTKESEDFVVQERLKFDRLGKDEQNEFLTQFFRNSVVKSDYDQSKNTEEEKKEEKKNKKKKLTMDYRLSWKGVEFSLCVKSVGVAFNIPAKRFQTISSHYKGTDLIRNKRSWTYRNSLIGSASFNAVENMYLLEVTKKADASSDPSIAIESIEDVKLGSHDGTKSSL